jgi:hypothetical protein
VDVMVCHYSEPCEESIETMRACLALEYPPSKLHIHVIDDGYLKSNFKKVQKNKVTHFLYNHRLSFSPINHPPFAHYSIYQLQEQNQTSTHINNICQ